MNYLNILHELIGWSNMRISNLQAITFRYASLFPIQTIFTKNFDVYSFQ